MGTDRSIFSVLLVLALPVVSLSLLNCGDTPSGHQTEQVCRPGDSIPCVCDDGQRGRQWCHDDGSAYAPCICLPADRDAEPDLLDDAGVDADAGADVQCPCLDDPVVSDGPDGSDAPDAAQDGDEGDPSQPDGSDRDVQDTAPDVGDVGTEPLVELGDDCSAASECETDICLGLTVNQVPHAVCARPCCHEEECPDGFGCLQAGAGRYCLPSRIFPAGYTFTADTGESCGIGGHECQSGICETSNDMCRGTCCTDLDCLAAPCHWSVAGSTLRTFCDPLALAYGYGRTGSLCTSELDCWNGVCVPSGASGYGVCADLCCSSSACPSGTLCGLVAGPTLDAVVRACVPVPSGAGVDGSPCSVDSSCASGLCVESRCRSLCCHDRDCTPPRRCLPRVTPENVLAPVCVDPEEEE